MSVDFQRRLAEMLWSIPGAQVINTEARLLERKLHDTITDNVYVVPNDTDNYPCACGIRHGIC